MKRLKARVRNGRLVMDEPTDLPEGTELELSAADEGDELDERERAALHAALADSWTRARAGDRREASHLLDDLKSRK